MTRLAGIDIGLPPELVLPLYLLLLLGLSALLARLVRGAAARWLGETAAPRLGLPISTAVVIGGLLLVLPELTLPPRLGKWITGALGDRVRAGVRDGAVAHRGRRRHGLRHPAPGGRAGPRCRARERARGSRDPGADHGAGSAGRPRRAAAHHAGYRIAGGRARPAGHAGQLLRGSLPAGRSAVSSLNLDMFKASVLF